MTLTKFSESFSSKTKNFSELPCLLEIGSVDRANRVLQIIGKGNKERLVPLPQPTLDDLGHLWRTHRNHRWLFANHRGDAPLIPS